MNHQYLLENNYLNSRVHLTNYVSVFNGMVIPFMRKFSIDDAGTIKKFIDNPDFSKMRDCLIEREESRGVGHDYAAMLIDNMMQKYFEENKYPGTRMWKDERSGQTLPLIPANPGHCGDKTTLIVTKDEEGRNVIGINDEALRKMHTKTLGEQEQKIFDTLTRFADEMNELGCGGWYLPDLFNQNGNTLSVAIYNHQ